MMHSVSAALNDMPVCCSVMNLSSEMRDIDAVFGEGPYGTFFCQGTHCGFSRQIHSGPVLCLASEL